MEVSQSQANTMAPAEAKPQGRSKYITKLPSSALLTHAVADAFRGFASVASLKVQEGKNDELLKAIVDQVSELSTDVSWNVYKSVEDVSSWLITETQLPASAQSTPKTVDSPLSGSDQFGHLDIEKDDRFTKILSSVRELLASPSAITRRRVLLEPEMTSMLLAKNTLVEIEKFKVKVGQEREVVTSAQDVFKSLIPKEFHEEVAIEVQQDLSDARIFYIIYHYESSEKFRDIHFSGGWSKWRQAMAPLLDGQSLRYKYVGLYHSSRGTGPVMIDSGSTDVRTPIADGKVAIDWATSEDGTGVVSDDSNLEPFVDFLRESYASYLDIKRELSTSTAGGRAGSLMGFSKAYRSFGLRRVANYGPSKQPGWLYRDWLPNAKAVCLSGEFNNWSAETHPLKQETESEWGPGVWSLFVPDRKDGKLAIVHKSKFKLHITTSDDTVVDRVSPWVTYMTKTEKSDSIEGVLWNPERKFKFVNSRPEKPKSLKIYEAHVGSCTPFQRVSTYNDMRKTVLPRITRLGYNTLLLLGVQGHNYYPSMGWHVTNFFAPSFYLGEPEELMQLIDTAHGFGMTVLISLVHSHASPAVGVGLLDFDGPESCYFRVDAEGNQIEWDAKIFNYEDQNVLRFLLGNLAYWIEDFNLDGFRFEGVTSMLYSHHGIGRSWSHDNLCDYSNYYNYDIDKPAMTYLTLANDLVHSLVPCGGITIANELSSFPTLCSPLEKGGIGFDYRSRNDQTAAWIQFTLDSDESTSIKQLVSVLERRRTLERTVACAESYDSCVLARRPLKIAMFTWESLLTHAVGGVAPHVTELAAALARLGHEVHVYVRATGEQNVVSVHYGVHYHECTFTLSSDFVGEMMNMCDSFYSNMRSTESFMKERFSVCHAHDWLAAKAAMKCAEDGHRVIQTIHSTEYGRCGNVSFGGESSRISGIESGACAAAGRVICVSGVLAEEVGNLYGVHPQKMRVIYNGINANQFDGLINSASIKEQYGIQAMEPFFLFVGRMAVQKGPDLLIEAIPYILQTRRDAKFVIVGDGYMFDGLRKRINELGIGHACRMIGKLGGPPLKHLFKACDAVVIPSRNEPFGIVVLEAWSAHKPVVATTCGGPRDFVSHDIDGFLVDPTPSSISWGCCKILENFDHARWMGSRGRVKAAFSFSWDTIGNQTRDLYNEQLAKSDAAYSIAARGDSTLASRLLCDSIFSHMTVFDDDAKAARGLALHKMIRLATCGLGGDSYMNTMGNEFGQPEFIDLPRRSNNFSYHHARTRWDLADDTALKFKHFQFFDACMIQWESVLEWLSSRNQYVSISSDEDKIVAFERGSCLFILNFHPHKSYEGYLVGHSLGVTDLQVFLDTDDGVFGGYGRISHEAAFPDLGKPHMERDSSIKVYIPNRAGMVLASAALLASVNKPPVTAQSCDEFVEMLEPHVRKPTAI